MVRDYAGAGTVASSAIGATAVAGGGVVYWGRAGN